MSSEKQYYDGTKLLSMLDINGNKPEIYICTSNRNAGKTTYFYRLLVNRFLDRGEKFGLIYRYNYELDDCSSKFFNDIGSLFFPGRTMTSERRAAGIYHELFLDGDSCGFAVSLNSCEQLKKYSHLLSDIKRMVFDEFQSETNRYCSNEVQKFISLHTTIARGHGKQVRYLPVYMISNPVSLINPYYTELGISSRLNDKVKFLKGPGFVLEQGFNESASQAQKESAFNQAFADNRYISYAAENIYLNDNKSFIEKPLGASRYMCTLKYENRLYALREYAEQGIIYCDDKPDKTFKYKITLTTDDHQINYVMLRKNDAFINFLKSLFERGCFRFKNLACKDVILKMFSY